MTAARLRGGLVSDGQQSAGRSQSIAALHQARLLLSDYEGWLVDLELELARTEKPSQALRDEVALYRDTVDYLREQFRMKREVVIDEMSDKDRPRSDYPPGAISDRPAWARDKQD